MTMSQFHLVISKTNQKKKQCVKSHETPQLCRTATPLNVWWPLGAKLPLNTRRHHLTDSVCCSCCCCSGPITHHIKSKNACCDWPPAKPHKLSFVLDLGSERIDHHLTVDVLMRPGAELLMTPSTDTDALSQVS